MEVRTATYQDLNPLVAFAKARHDASDWAVLPFSPTKVRNNIVTMIRTEGMDVLLAEDEGEICGMLLAGIDQFFFNNMTYATDVHFVAERGGFQILRAFFRWAEERGCRAVIMSVANSDPEGRVAKFYESCGMQSVGNAFVRWLGQEPAEEQVA